MSDMEKLLIKTLDEMIDYAMSMKMATGYAGIQEPNFLEACRLVASIKGDFKVERSSS